MVQFNYKRSQSVTVFLAKYYPFGKAPTTKEYKIWENLNSFEEKILSDLPKELKYKRELQVNALYCFSYCGNCGKEIVTAEELINKMKPVESKDVLSGDLVFYWNSNRQEYDHCGIVEESGKVKSKWGGFPVFMHNVFDVPYKKFPSKHPITVNDFITSNECEITFYRHIKENPGLD